MSKVNGLMKIAERLEKQRLRQKRQLEATDEQLKAIDDAVQAETQKEAQADGVRSKK